MCEVPAGTSHCIAGTAPSVAPTPSLIATECPQRSEMPYNSRQNWGRVHKAAGRSTGLHVGPPDKYCRSRALSTGPLGGKTLNRRQSFFSPPQYTALVERSTNNAGLALEN